MDTNDLHKEIDLIQSCINRMSQNSFMLKGWAFSIFAIVFALVSSNMNEMLLLIAIGVPLICFWILDAYYLRLEKMYRKMYKNVVDCRLRGLFDNLYDLDPHQYKKEVPSLLKVLFSCSLLLFYLSLLLVVILFTVIFPISGLIS